MLRVRVLNTRSDLNEFLNREDPRVKNEGQADLVHLYSEGFATLHVCSL